MSEKRINIMDCQFWEAWIEQLAEKLNGIRDVANLILKFLPSYIIFKHFQNKQSVFFWKNEAEINVQSAFNTQVKGHSENIYFLYSSHSKKSKSNYNLNCTIFRATHPTHPPTILQTIRSARAVAPNIKCSLGIIRHRSKKRDEELDKLFLVNNDIEKSFQILSYGWGYRALDLDSAFGSNNILPLCDFASAITSNVSGGSTSQFCGSSCPKLFMNALDEQTILFRFKASFPKIHVPSSLRKEN